VTRRPRLVVASLNRSKAAEIARILSDEGVDFEVLSLADFPEVELPPETGETFAENALAKARRAAAALGMAAAADDSGLEVEALHGAPGVLSARYAGEAAGDEDRYRKLLAEMREVPDSRRAARFHCAAAYATPDGEVLLAEGTCEGTIAREPSGSGGFGYDPIFIPEAEARTMAQFTPAEKHAISHRGRAFRKLATLIREQLEAAGSG
jgi:XTP/dITP diphosphohydrolase